MKKINESNSNLFDEFFDAKRSSVRFIRLDKELVVYIHAVCNAVTEPRDTTWTMLKITRWIISMEAKNKIKSTKMPQVNFMFLYPFSSFQFQKENEYYS